MRFSAEPSVVEFLKVYDKTPSCDRKQIPLEAIALKAESNFNELLGAIVMSFRSIQAQKSALKAMAAHPDVVDATVESAKLKGGYSDRKMLHEAVGFLPTPKGTSINFSFGQQGKMPEAEEENDTLSPPEVTELFPMITEREEKWQADRSRLLEEKN